MTESIAATSINWIDYPLNKATESQENTKIPTEVLDHFSSTNIQSFLIEQDQSIAGPDMMARIFEGEKIALGFPSRLKAGAINGLISSNLAEVSKTEITDKNRNEKFKDLSTRLINAAKTLMKVTPAIEDQVRSIAHLLVSAKINQVPQENLATMINQLSHLATDYDLKNGESMNSDNMSHVDPSDGERTKGNYAGYRHAELFLEIAQEASKTLKKENGSPDTARQADLLGSVLYNGLNIEMGLTPKQRAEGASDEVRSLGRLIGSLAQGQDEDTREEVFGSAAILMNWAKPSNDLRKAMKDGSSVDGEAWTNFRDQANITRETQEKVLHSLLKDLNGNLDEASLAKLSKIKDPLALFDSRKPKTVASILEKVSEGAEDPVTAKVEALYTLQQLMRLFK